MRAAFWGITDTGRVRRDNQDDFLLDPELGLAVVADGVGGLPRGEVAAQLACRAVREHLRRSHRALHAYGQRVSLHGRNAVLHELRSAVQAASSEVHRAGGTLTGRAGMMCTLAVAVLTGPDLFVAHVGDARVYKIADGRAHLLTEDHTVAQEKVRRGDIRQEEAATAPGANVLTRAVGALPSVQVDAIAIPAAVGDRYVLCSDGLTRHVHPDEIARLLEPGDEFSLRETVRLVNARGGRDNVTIALLAVEEDRTAERPITSMEIEDLRRIRAFEAATVRELALLRRMLDERVAKPGTLLLREGAAGQELFLLLEGQVAITRNGHHLATIEPGAMFGEMALVDHTVRSASALATQPSRLLVLNRQRFEQLLRQDDPLTARLMWGLLQQLTAIVRGSEP